MWCGVCRKFKTKLCPRRSKINLKLSPACSEFFLYTAKLSSRVLKGAIYFSSLPKTQVMLLMALLDSSLRLKPQGLSIGATTLYNMEVKKTGEKQSFSMERVHLVSAPKKEDFAFGVAFLEHPKKKITVSIMMKKKCFLDSRDKKLKKLWKKIEYVLMQVDDLKRKNKIILKTVKKMRKDHLQKMIDQQGLNIRVKGKKIEEVARVLSSYF